MTELGSLVDRLDSLFAAIDAKNTDAFLDFLADDGSFRFGSAPELHGHAAIKAGVDGFFASIAGSRHSLLNILYKDATLVCEGEVTYIRHDASELTLPFTNVFELSGELISRYKIYIDIAPLFAE